MSMKILDEYRGGRWLTEDKVKEILGAYNIPTPTYVVIENEHDITEIELKFPVVLKVCSENIIHKTEAGGVVLDIKDKKSLKKEFRLMREKLPSSRFLVETMEKKGLEVIVGLINDSTFGLCIMFGLGGIFTEILEDVSFRLVPITELDAARMMKELKSHKALEGFRGMKINKESIIELLKNVSKLGDEYRQHIGQLDLNPVIVREDGLSVVDAKLLTKKDSKDIQRKQHDVSPFDSLKSLLYPRNIAVIGASTHPEKEGYILLKNLIDGGFTGTIFPINPNIEEVLGLKTKKSILDIDEDLDLAIVAVGARLVPQIVEECGKKGVKGLLVVSAGFREIGDQGKQISTQVESLLERYNLKIIGPNSQGIVNVNQNFCAAFDIESLIPLFIKGGIGLITQSGSVGSNFIQSALKERIGFSIWVNVGNKMAVDEADLIKFMNEDPNITVIASYLEDIKNGGKFIDATKNLNKPMVILKSGRTKAGQKAAQSHTAALAGNDKILDGILEQYNVYRAETTDDLYDLSKALYFLRPPKGNKLLIIESTGGLGIIASDIAEKAGLELPDLDKETKEKIKEFFPPFLAPCNPLDVASSFSEPYERVAEVGVMDGYDALLLIFGDPVANASNAVAAFKRNTNKPIIVAFSGGGKTQKKETEKIIEINIPVFPNVERATKFFEFCAKHAKNEKSS